MLNLTIKHKGSKTSGWYAPPRGTHTGEKHRAVGSGKASVAVSVGQEPPKTKHEPTASDILALRANTETAQFSKGGAISPFLTDYMQERTTYTAFDAADNKEEFIASTYTALARRLGFETEIRVVDDKEFNSTFAGAKISKFGEMMGGINTATAGYHTARNVVYLRKRSVSGAVGSYNKYRLFRSAIYHELGHAYHANVWDIRLQDKGEYGSGWCEQFAESFSNPLAYGNVAMRAISRGKAPTARLMKRYREFDVVDSLTRTISDNKPKGSK